ncbi:MAG TPA: ankyrin repeat domain-containing protein [Candidatus Saccharimonadales bacterium]|nr:ankyrin repeat domain-containing protein [Candidatus Saccharimonadales bacterium]
MKKILNFYFLIGITHLFYCAQVDSLALLQQENALFKKVRNVTCSFHEVDIPFDTTRIDREALLQNEYECTKNAIITNDIPLFDQCMHSIPSERLKRFKDNLQGSTLLHIAAEVGNAYAIEELLKKGLSVHEKTFLDVTDTSLTAPANQQFVSHRTPLHAAYLFSPMTSQYFDPQVVELLVNAYRGVINEPDAFGKTPVHYATCLNKLALLKKLLALQADPTIKDKNGYTALDHAISSRNIHAAEILLDHIGCKYWNLKKDILLKLMEGPQYTVDLDQRLQLESQFTHDELQTLLCDVINMSKNPVLVALLLENGLNPNFHDMTMNSPMFTPLHLAALYGQLEIVKLLLKHGANKDAVNLHNDTPLHSVIVGVYPHCNISTFDRIKIVRLLLELGANKEITNEHGLTPLGKAVNCNNVEIVKILLAAQANPNITDDNGLTLLHAAVSYRSMEIIKALCAAGANMNMQDDEGGTPLYNAARDNQGNIVKILLLTGADPNIQGDRSRTPLQKAAQHQCIDMVKALCHAGANPNIADNDGQTPLHEAAIHQKIEIIQTLLAHGARINIQDTIGKTPLHEAVLYDRVEIIKALLAAGADPTIKDVVGQTALDEAMKPHRNPIVKELLRGSVKKIK